MSIKPTLSYVIVDPRPIAAEAPYTFFLPTELELGAIAPGDLVKLIFELVPPGETYTAERMWVGITEIGPNGILGTLDNEPYEAQLRPGDIIEFQRYNVIAVDFGDRAASLPRDHRREYWERCLVDRCVLDDSEPVEFLYREEPDVAHKGDEYPDSGWRIRGRRGSTTDDDMDNRKLGYVALGAVLNRDDSWLHLIDAPVGSAFMRDFENNLYAPETG